VALTADATAEVGDRCQRAGMDGCLTKPIEPARLVEMIDWVVRTKRHAASILGDEEEEAEVAAEAAAGDSLPAIELQKLKELERLGGSAFVDDLVQQFLDDSVSVLRDLSDAVHSGNVESFREQAHALRSGAANVGARGIYQMCLDWRQIDSSALRRDGEHHVHDLEAEFERVRVALQSKAAA
jgi:two-component system sensor histidine kinase RpfC